MSQLVIGTRRWLGAGWTHLDADSKPLLASDGSQHWPEIIGDARSIPRPDNYFDHVYSQECLEHFPWQATASVLAEWCRVVKPGGTIRVEVPDFLAACRQVLDTDTLEMDLAIQQIIFGGQENKWDIHYAGLTPRILSAHLAENHFKVGMISRGFDVGYLRVDALKL